MSSDSKFLKIAQAAAVLLEGLDEDLTFPKRTRPAQRQFEKSIWKIFDPRVALEITSRGASTFPGHKEAVFFALCSWAISPHDTQLIRSAIAQSVLKSIADAEDSASDQTKSLDGVETDLLARFGLLGGSFLREVYFPIGGARAFRSCMPVKQFLEVQENAYGSLLYSIKIVEFAHHHLNVLKDARKYGSPSLNKSSKLFSKFGIKLGSDKKPPHERSIVSYWTNNKKSIALSYAAHSILLDDGKSMLENMVRGNLSYEKGVTYIDEWMKRARFVNSHILARMSEKGTFEDLQKIIPSGDVVPFPLPSLSIEEAEMIRVAYQRSAV